jgi:hypothetical protein
VSDFIGEYGNWAVVPLPLGFADSAQVSVFKAVHPLLLKKLYTDSHTLMADINAVLLSVLDPQIEMELTQDEFEERLVHEVLFMPRLFAPDILFFISDALWSHVTQSGAKPEESLFCRALAEHIILPAFREPAESRRQFPTVFRERLKGRPGVRKWAETFAGILQRSWARNDAKDALFFPTASAEYLKLFCEGIVDAPTDRLLEFVGRTPYASEEEEFLNNAKYYFKEILHEVRKSSKPGELTRSEVQRCIGERRNLPKEVWENSDTLVHAHESENEQRLLRFCLGILHSCYHAALAAPFQSRPAYSTWTKAERIVSSFLRPSVGTDDQFSAKMKVPSYAVMAKDPEALIKARINYGQTYIEKAEAWCGKSPGISKDDVLAQLNVYAESLCKAFPAHRGASDLLTVLGTQTRLLSALGGGALGGVTYTFLSGPPGGERDLWKPLAGVAGTLLPAGAYLIYDLTKRRHRKRQVSLQRRPVLAHPIAYGAAV